MVQTSYQLSLLTPYSRTSINSILSRACKARAILCNVFNSTLPPFSIREIAAGLVWSCAANCVCVRPRFSLSSAKLTAKRNMSKPSSKDSLTSGLANARLLNSVYLFFLSFIIEPKGVRLCLFDYLFIKFFCHAPQSFLQSYVFFHLFPNPANSNTYR